MHPLPLMRRAGAALACTLATLAAVAAPPASAHGRGNDFPHPLVIGHRGASGYLPEHTLESYALAIELGADYIEPDLVATKDGHLIARHEPNITNTTNVASLPQFADRRRTMLVDGAAETGWFASDFTLAEIKLLRAVQTVGVRDKRFDGQFQVPTLEEVIDLAKRKAADKRRPIGVYPETKHPTYHQQLGLALEDRLLRVLTRAGWNHRQAPVFIQSFETANLRYLRTKTRVRLVQLVDADDLNPDGTLAFNPPFHKPYDWVVSGRPGLFKDLLTPAGLAEVASYADGVGPWKYYLQSTACKVFAPSGGCADANGDGQVNEADRTLLAPSSVVADAHARGLLVHPYTFRNERNRQALEDNFTPASEYLRFYALGVDGLFSDFPDTAVAARVMHKLKADPGYARCLVQANGCRDED